MTLASWFHDLSPFAIRFSGDFGIRWYGLAYLAGFAVAYLALRALAHRKLIAIPEDRVGDAMLWLVGGTLVGGRLGYVLIYDLVSAIQQGVRPLLFSFSSQFPWWGLLAINQGGMASHGGMVGVILACWRISRGFRDQSGRIVGRTSMLHVIDITAAVVPAGLLFGRLANFVNGELLGAIVTPPGVEGPWWTVQYPQELDLADFNTPSGIPKPGIHLQQTPDQWSQILGLARDADPKSIHSGLHRLAHESWLYADKLKPLISSRHPSQLYQAFAEGIVLGAVLWIVWAKPRKPGVIGALFLIIYGILRVATEIWRLPDPQLSKYAGLSVGQWLSVAMIVIGAYALFLVARRPVQKLGGWRTATVS